MSKIAGENSIKAIRDWANGKFPSVEITSTDPGAGSTTSEGVITFVYTN